MKLSSAARSISALVLCLAACGRDGLLNETEVGALSVATPSLPAQGARVNSKRVTFSGRSTAPSGSRIAVVALDGRLGSHACAATVAANQTWSCSQNLEDGGYTWTARVDPGGLPSAGIDFVVRTHGLPAPLIDHTPSPTNDAKPVLTGTVDRCLVGSEFFLEVSENGKVLCTVHPVTSTQWFCRLTNPLADGPHLLVAHVDTDDEGTPDSNPNLFVVKTSVSNPTIAPIPSPTNLNKPTFSGTGEPGAVVTVTDSGAVICVAAVAASGGWSCTAADPLPDGSHTVSATQTDAAGNTAVATASFEIDTHVPDPPTLEAPHTPTSNPRVTLGGRGEPGDEVSVMHAFSRLLCKALVAASGRWQCAPEPLEDGQYLLSAFQVTRAGNRSLPSAPAAALVVDTIAPAPPVLDAPASPTRKHRPAVSGSAEAASAVSVTDADSGASICGAIANGAGAFNCTPEAPLAAGRYRFTAVATDAAGNTSLPANPVSVTISDVVPPPPTIESPPDGAEVEEGRPFITGRTALGTLVDVTLDGVTYAAQVDPDGRWTLVPPAVLRIGVHQISATATDAQLNVSDPTASRFSRVEIGVARGGCASGGLPWPALALLGFLLARPRQRARAGLLAALAAALPLAARAQLQSVDVSLFRPASGGDGFAAVEGARPPLGEESLLELRVWSDYAVHPLVFESQSGSSNVLIRSRAGGWLGLQAHLLGPLSVAAQVPVTFAQRGDLSGLPPSSRGPSSLLGGFGDLRVTPRLALLRQEWAGIDLAGQMSLELPTARGRTLTDDGRVRVEGLVALGRRLGEVARGSLDLLANAYVRLRPPRELLDVKAGNEVGLRAGLGYELPLARPWLPRRVYAELEGRTFLRAGFAAGSAPAEWRLGATVCPVRSLAIDLAGGGALSNGVGAPRAHFLLGAGWSPSACGAEPAAAPLARAAPPPSPPPSPSAPPEPPAIVQAPPPRAPLLEPDRDGDGIPDADDACPDQPGPRDNQGCPRTVKQLVVVSATKIDILEQVRFATGKARIEPQSHRLLDQLAAVLRSHPDLLLVQVEGHTDSRGSTLGNVLLSQARAEAVVSDLISKGVAPDRLRARGFGQGRPIATNATPEGRAANRRVAFTVLRTRSRVIEAQRQPDS